MKEWHAFNCGNTAHSLETALQIVQEKPGAVIFSVTPYQYMIPHGSVVHNGFMIVYYFESSLASKAAQSGSDNDS